MRSLRLASFSLALASPAFAQLPSNYHEHWSGCTNYTSRGTLGSSGGDILVAVPATNFAGVGHDPSGAGTRLLSLRCVLQDQNPVTPEDYDLIIRSDNGGAPDPTPAGVILQVGPFTSPGGTIGWMITHTLATPATSLPLCATYYHGANIRVNAAWTADGLSFHICTYFPLQGLVADNPAPVGAMNLAWDILAGVPRQPTPRGIRFGLGVEASVLTMGNTDPTLIANTSNCVSSLINGAGIPRSFGGGGLWPGKGGGRDDGLDCRVSDGANANGVFATFLGNSLGCPGLALPGIANGALYLNPSGPLVQVATGAIDSSGVGIATILGPGQAPASVVNRRIDFQAFSVGPTFVLPGMLSNRASVIYR